MKPRKAVIIIPTCLFFIVIILIPTAICQQVDKYFCEDSCQSDKLCAKSCRQIGDQDLERSCQDVCSVSRSNGSPRSCERGCEFGVEFRIKQLAVETNIPPPGLIRNTVTDTGLELSWQGFEPPDGFSAVGRIVLQSREIFERPGKSEVRQHTFLF